jgi:hypothetical protein
MFPIKRKFFENDEGDISICEKHNILIKNE